MAKSYSTFWFMRRQAEKLSTLTDEIEKHLPKAWGLAVTSLPAFRDLQGLAEAQAEVYDEPCVWCGEDHPDDECPQRDRWICPDCGLIEDERAGRWGGHTSINGTWVPEIRYCLTCHDDGTRSMNETKVKLYFPHHPCTRCDEQAEEGQSECPTCIHEDVLAEARLANVPYPSDMKDDPHVDDCVDDE